MELLFARVVARGLSVRETEQAAQALNQGRRGKAKKPSGRMRDPNVREVEERLVERFGTKVQIRGGPAKGRIEIAYFSADDLERVLELLQGRK
jgi:ParB family chromosome partitioning protein